MQIIVSYNYILQQLKVLNISLRNKIIEQDVKIAKDFEDLKYISSFVLRNYHSYIIGVT
jgi:hypothetical protein